MAQVQFIVEFGLFYLNKRRQKHLYKQYQVDSPEDPSEQICTWQEDADYSHAFDFVALFGGPDQVLEQDPQNDKDDHQADDVKLRVQEIRRGEAHFLEPLILWVLDLYEDFVQGELLLKVQESKILKAEKFDHLLKLDEDFAGDLIVVEQDGVGYDLHGVDHCINRLE